ncbi:Ankyrin repeat domain-containing protein 40 [Choanephora cucurbitarum]|uniref:Ankyrin repeat domain-containing protein 40 n=1 Tax=Choanephora cucurbitarum TaxID=101091 RepID=A0A1C7NG52_9FUNG|nr:Ankyrin repeat domain-containing protein 40 [Choanephora cucurbitarum]
MPLGDEREHTLREVAALGNIKATLHLAHSGVNVNSQNAMNGWTALHWAAHRGHEHVVTALLRSGADPLIKTQKGQTALDLAAHHPPVIEILQTAVSESDAAILVGPEPSLPIVPTYLSNPDLEKTWLMPDEFSENKIENVVRKQTAAEAVNNNTTTTHSSAPSVSHQEKEVLVYLSKREDENILGSVFLRNESIEKAVEAIKEELDGLPENFTLARHNGKISIPINTKQMSKQLLDIFRGEEDALVIVPQP